MPLRAPALTLSTGVNQDIPSPNPALVSTAVDLRDYDLDAFIL